MREAASMRILGVKRPEEPVRAGKPVVVLVERHHYFRCSSQDSLPLNCTVITGVETVITIIPHHEVMALGHSDRTKAPFCRKVRHRNNGVSMSGQLFGSEEALRLFGLC